MGAGGKAKAAAAAVKAAGGGGASAAMVVDTNPTLAERVLAFLAFHVLTVPPAIFVATIALAPLRVKAQCMFAYFLFFTWAGCPVGCENKYGSPWRKFSEDFFLLRAARSYLRISFGPVPRELADAEGREGAQFVFAAFPHGCNSEFRTLFEGMLQDVIPNVYGKTRALSASVLFRIPLLREMALWLGCVDASRKTAERNLDRGHSLVVLPGGEAEQIMTECGRERIYLKNRKGFVKLAMRKRCPVVPIYVFGCSDSYRTTRVLYGIRHWLVRRCGICIPLCRGLFGSPMCPLPKKVTVVLGKPLEFEMEGASPTDAELDAAHDRFMRELTSLFDKHKDSCGYGDRVLEIS